MDLESSVCLLCSQGLNMDLSNSKTRQKYLLGCIYTDQERTWKHYFQMNSLTFKLLFMVNGGNDKKIAFLALTSCKYTLRTTFPECTVVPLLLGAEAVIAPGAVVGGFGVAAVVLGGLKAPVRKVRGGVGRLQGPAPARVTVLSYRLLPQVTFTLPVIVRTTALCNVKQTSAVKWPS